jgi:transmembrane sensor
MKNVTRRRAIDYVQPELSPARVERLWAGVEHAQGLRRVRPLLPLMAAVTVLAVLAFAVGSWLQSASTKPGDVIVTRDQSSALTLPDGSALQLGAATSLEVTEMSPAAVRLRLTHGSVFCDVAPRATRSFRVDAPAASVLVKGTRFEVVAAREGTSVRVEHGSVEVRSRDGQRVLATLEAGQAWSQRQLSAAAEPTLLPPAAPTVVAEPASLPPPAAPEPAAKPARKTREPVETASELFQRANRERMEGHAQAAAAAYEKLRKSYPRDARAGLAAFELGRIRLDTLHDPQAALTAFEFALAHPRGFVVEDAEALKIDALSRLGDAVACARARDRFLLQYPKGAQRARVTAACRTR